jgi:predicted N-acetyltransferase YhbS
MIVRKALPADMDEVYLNGRDAWGTGKTVAEYLDSCRNSVKYKEGEWFLLEDGAAGPAASLTVYRLPPDAAGLGSIAVAPERRGKGLATRLIKDMLEKVDAEGVPFVFLFSDIDPTFYAPFGFEALPAEHQKKPGSVCMIRGRGAAAKLSTPGFRPPDYF